MAERPDEQEKRARRKETVSGMLGGCGLLLFFAGLVAAAVLLRVSWYSD